MENHYTASEIACEAQQYLDRGIKSDKTTSHDTAYYMHKSQRPSWGNVPIKQKQPLRTSRQPPDPQQTIFTTPYKRDHYRPFKICNIKAYVNSCDICAKCKGNYDKRASWSIGHCKRGKRPFEFVFIDFVTAQLQRQALHPHYPRQLQQTLYCHTMYKGPSNQHCSWTVLIFLRHREILQIVSSTRGTHLASEVYRQFFSQISVISELHCSWRLQSSGNIERQHGTIKNTLYMLCEDRNCEWTDILESVSPSMNATINSATGVSPHYTIIGAPPQYRSAQITQKGDRKRRLGSLWHANKFSLKASPSPRHPSQRRSRPQNGSQIKPPHLHGPNTGRWQSSNWSATINHSPVITSILDRII